MSRSDSSAPPVRFVDARPGDSLPSAESAADLRIGALLRQVPAPPPLPPPRLSRVALGLTDRLARQSDDAAVVRVPRPRTRWRRFGIVLVLLGGTSGVVFARESIVDWVRAARARLAPAAVSSLPVAPVTESIAPLAVPAESAAEAPAKRTMRAAARVARPPVPPVLAVPEATPPAGPAVRHRPRVAGRPAVAPRTLAMAPPAARAETLLAPPDETNVADLIRQPLAPPPAARSSYRRLGDETVLLRQALQNLRHDDDPAAALESLDEYDRRFPFGVLRPSAALVRIDSLVALGRHDEAQALLEALPLTGNPRHDDLEITRGELRARRDCRAAMGDFSRALARNPDAPLLERALRGRAQCAQRMGDEAASRADLERYLERFPSTPFAADARRMLGR